MVVEGRKEFEATSQAEVGTHHVQEFPLVMDFDKRLFQTYFEKSKMSKKGMLPYSVTLDYDLPILGLPILLSAV